MKIKLKMKPSEPPPRPSADMRYYRCQKIIGGIVFQGLDTTHNLLSDLRPFEAATAKPFKNCQITPLLVINAIKNLLVQF